MTTIQIITFIANKAQEAIKKYEESTTMNGHYIVSDTYSEILKTLKIENDIEVSKDIIVALKDKYDLEYYDYTIKNPGKVMHNAAIRSLACEKVLKYIKNDKSKF